jgi:hypothetical protein
MNQFFQVLKSGVASSPNLQVTSRGHVCVYQSIVQGLLEAQGTNSVQKLNIQDREVTESPRGKGVVHQG